MINMTALQKISRQNLMRFVYHQNFAASARLSSTGGHVVQMRGLDYDTTEDDVKDFFKPLGITPVKIHLKCDGSGRTAGFSEVEFSSHAEAVIALRKKNAFIGNKFIRLSLKASSLDSVKSSDAENSSTTNVENQKTLTSLKADDKILESLYSSGHVIRMKNAPWRITEQDIYNFFCPVGARPVSVKPLYNESGIRTGEFDVKFLTLDDVKKAAFKNHGYLRNRYVELSFNNS